MPTGAIVGPSTVLRPTLSFVEGVGGTIKLLASRFAVSLISLAFYGIAAHTVPAADLAPLAAMAVIAELFRASRSMGLTATMLRQMPECIARDDRERAAAFVRSTLLYTTIISVALAAGAWLFRGTIGALIIKQDTVALDFAIIIAFALLMGVYDSLQLALQSLQRFGRQGAVYFVTMTTQRCLALALLFPYGVRGCLIGFLIGAAVGVLLSAFWLREYVFRRARLLGFAGLFGYSYPYYAQEFARYICQEADQLVIGLFGPAHLFVLYFLAKRIAHGMRMAMDAATDVLRPMTGELRARGEAAVREGFLKSSRFMSYLALPLGFGVAAISRPFIALYAGPQYAGAGDILLVLSLAMTVYGYFGLYEANVYMLGRPIHRLAVDLFTSAVTLALLFALIRPLGGLGAALAQLVALGLGLAFSALLLRRIQDLRPDTRAFWRTFCAAGAMFGIVAAVSHLLPSPYLLPTWIALGGVTFAALFALSLRRTELDEIRASVPQFLRPCARLLERLTPTVTEEERHG